MRSHSHGSDGASPSRLDTSKLFLGRSFVYVAYWLLVLAVCLPSDTLAEEETVAVLPKSWAALADAGVDAAELQAAVKRNAQPLVAGDGQVMAQLEAAVADWSSLAAKLGTPWELRKLLEDTSGSIGQPVRIQGSVKQCVPISMAGDNTAGQRFQLTIFPNLDGQRLTMKGPAGQPVRYERLAVTVRAGHLPAGATCQTLLGRRVQVDGIHYRFWSYDSEFAARQGIDGQISPLVFAGRLQAVATSAPPGRLPVWLLLMLLGGVAALATWSFLAK